MENFCCAGIRLMRVLRPDKEPEVFLLTIEPNFSLKLSGLLVPKYTFEPALIIVLHTSVVSVLTTRRNAQVLPTIIRPVQVSVVHRLWKLSSHI
jgi:hypothetical protein